MKNIKNREKSLAVITAFVILGAVIYNVVLDPQLQKRDILLAKMHQLQLDLTTMRGDLLLKDNIERTYSKLESLISTDKTRLEEIGLFSSEIGNLYKNLDVEPRTMTINPVTDEKYYIRLSISMELIGNIKDIIKLINLIENYQSPIRIEKMEIVPRDISDYVTVTFLLTKVIVEQEV